MLIFLLIKKSKLTILLRITSAEKHKAFCMLSANQLLIMQSLSLGRHMFILDVTVFYYCCEDFKGFYINVLHYFMAVMKKIWGF